MKFYSIHRITQCISIIVLIGLSHLAYAQDARQVELKTLDIDVNAPFDLDLTINEDLILTPQVQFPLWVDFRGPIERYLAAGLTPSEPAIDLPEVPRFGHPGVGTNSARQDFRELLSNIEKYQSLAGARNGNPALLEVELLWLAEIEQRMCSLFRRIYGGSNSGLTAAWISDAAFKASVRRGDGSHSLEYRRWASKAEADYLDDINAIFGDPLIACLDRLWTSQNFSEWLRVKGYFNFNPFGEFGLPLSAEIRYDPHERIFVVQNRELRTLDGLARIPEKIGRLREYWEFKQVHGIINRWDAVALNLLSGDEELTREQQFDLVMAAIERTEQRLVFLRTFQTRLNELSSIVEKIESQFPVNEERVTASEGPYLVLSDVRQACIAYQPMPQVVIDRFALETVCSPIWQGQVDGLILPNFVSVGFAPTRAGVISEVQGILSEIGISDASIVQEVSCLIIIASWKSIEKRSNAQFPEQLVVESLIAPLSAGAIYDMRRGPYDFECEIQTNGQIYWRFVPTVAAYWDLPSRGLDLSVGINREYESTFHEIDKTLSDIVEATLDDATYGMHVGALQRYVSDPALLQGLRERHFAANMRFAQSIFDEYQEASLLYESGVNWGVLSRHYLRPKFSGRITKFAGQTIGKASTLAVFQGEDVDRNNVSIADVRSDIQVVRVGDVECKSYMRRKVESIQPDGILVHYADQLCFAIREVGQTSDGHLHAFYDFGRGVELIKYAAAIHCRTLFVSANEIRLLGTASEAERSCVSHYTIAFLLSAYGEFFELPIEYQTEVADTRFGPSELPYSLINLDRSRYGLSR